MRLTRKHRLVHGDTGEFFPRDTLTLMPPAFPSPFSELSGDGENFPPFPREAEDKSTSRSQQHD